MAAHSVPGITCLGILANCANAISETLTFRLNGYPKKVLDALQRQCPRNTEAASRAHLETGLPLYDPFEKVVLACVHVLR